ncbi:unnamed protein product [Calypogeia fissa]
MTLDDLRGFQSEVPAVCHCASLYGLRIKRSQCPARSSISPSFQRRCTTLGVEDLSLLSGEELHARSTFIVFFNGNILGVHRRPLRFADHLRKLRRAGKIGEFVSIHVHAVQRCIYIAADGGRVCRPLVIADKGISRVKEHHMKELEDPYDYTLKSSLILVIHVENHHSM